MCFPNTGKPCVRGQEIPLIPQRQDERLTGSQSKDRDAREVMSMCNDCMYFQNDPKAIEAALPGLTILGSAYSSSRGDAGICEQQDVFLVPVEQCSDFAMKTGGVKAREILRIG